MPEVIGTSKNPGPTTPTKDQPVRLTVKKAPSSKHGVLEIRSVSGTARNVRAKVRVIPRSMARVATE